VSGGGTTWTIDSGVVTSDKITDLTIVDGDISATADQQLAGLIMKVGNLPIIWPILLVLFVKWSRADQSATPPPPRPAVDVLAGTAAPAESQSASS
jgi:hypothetical protein